jgi:hypothetical protein
MEQQGNCVKARLVAQMQDGSYTVYVFQDLTSDEFIMCTRCPNWMGEMPTLMQEGFLRYRFVRAGTDTYFDQRSGNFVAYQYTNTYFLDFVPITHVLKDGYVTDLSTTQLYKTSTHEVVQT